MKRDRPRLLIIHPSFRENWWNGKVLVPPLALPLLAGLTPLDVEVQLWDENLGPVKNDAQTDWVAISCMTASAPRGYEIADAFRERGIPVIMGGIHPTVMPEEALQHSDAVVVGEAEGVWPEVLAGFARGKFEKRIYQSPVWCDMVGLPRPRFELLCRDAYLTTNVIQTMRGCPNGCAFCTVRLIAGPEYRVRPVGEVVEELSRLSGWVGIVDDNVTGEKERAKRLFEAMIPLNLAWVGQGDLKIANDKELLDLAVRSGCKALFIGIESVNKASLKEGRKFTNLGLDVREALKRIRKAGIGVVGSFVFGFDSDDLGVFGRTVEFAEENGLVAAQFAMLTPFPGTGISEQLEVQGRVLSHDWGRYTMSNAVFSPVQMTPAQLEAGQRFAYDRFYSITRIGLRSLRSDSIEQAMRKLLVGLSYRGVGRKTGLNGLLHRVLPK